MQGMPGDEGFKILKRVLDAAGMHEDSGHKAARLGLGA